jgi:lactoylglutathione lyase
MRALAINHISVSAVEMDESLRFYVDLLGAERIPAPDFGMHVEWMRIGDLQLHLFKRGDESPTFHHFGVTVDDFVGCYRQARERGVLDNGFFDGAIHVLPDGTLQMYLRDPAGNLVEINGEPLPADELARAHEAIPELKRLSDVRPQTGDHGRARLLG